MPAATFTLSDSLLEQFRALVGDDNLVTKEESVDKLSKDFYWYSPVLKRQLEEKRAHFAVKVDSLDTLKAAVSLACKERIPVCLRGGGTGNYGQLIPLYGGVLIDISGMDRILSLEGGIARTEPGARLFKIEAEANAAGYELRCMPSTWVKSSMGGFLAGGSGGIGSITYGGISHGDNMVSLTILTVEETPRILKFEGTDCYKALHTYGTNGIIVESEMRLGERRDYDQLIVVHPDWDTLFSWLDDLAHQTELPKRLVTAFEAPIPGYFLPLKKHLDPEKQAGFAIVDQAHTEAVVKSAESAGLEVTFNKPWPNPPKPPYITDYTWNHTTLWALKVDPTITYLQLGFGDEGYVERMKLMKERYPEEFFHHIEWTISRPKVDWNAQSVNVGGLPIIMFKNEARLQEIMDYAVSIGGFLANPHTFYLEEGGAHPDIEEKRKLKSEVDPAGILNPGKMKTYTDNPFATVS
ncbi:MAG: FAD-binding oxidoreductase [Opitutales bacterium]